jgi:hypothetical protein
MGEQHFKFLSSMRKTKNQAGLFKLASYNLYFTMFKEDLKHEQMKFQSKPTKDLLRFSWNYPKVSLYLLAMSNNLEIKFYPVDSKLWVWRRGHC